MLAPDHYPLVYLSFALTHALTAALPAPTPPAAAPAPDIPNRPLIFGLDRFIRWLAPALLLLVGALLVCGAVVPGVMLGASLSLGWVRARRGARLRYEHALAEYQAALARHQAYPALWARYEQVLADARHPQAQLRYQRQRVATLLTAAPLACRPVPAAEPTPVRGRSEAFFLPYLRQHFGQDSILTNCRVPVEDPRRRAAWYYPDFVYRDASGLHIDIEIDEPYSLATGEPIHCRGQDDYRNGFFIGKHWLVVRFTEEQVLTQPLLCCQLLAAQIYQLTGRHYAARFYYERLTPCPQWDERQARRMAVGRSRKQYGTVVR